MSSHAELEKAVGHRFAKRALLEAALTHPSFRHENPSDDADNQRLEFLGDAVLALAVAQHLYENCPDLDEGEMTRQRSRITSTRALAIIAAAIGLGAYLRLGRGEMAAGGNLRDSILADALEAVIGAAWLDGGQKAVAKIFRTLFEPVLRENLAAQQHDNPKGALQEWAQRNALTNPRYRIASQHGPPHAVVFFIEACIGETVVGMGEGTSKQAAEIAAANDALRHPERLPPTPPEEKSPTPGFVP